MPGYVKNALHKFQHPTPQKSQDNPYPATAKQYGMKVQLMDPIDMSAPLPLHEVKHLQQIIGTFLFYGHAVDPSILRPSANSHPTKPLPQKLPNAPATSFSTIVPPTPMAPFATMPAT